MMPGGRVGVVAGSGIDLASLFDRVDETRAFESFEGLRRPGIDGHAGHFVTGECEGRSIVVQQGRLHIYEGHSYRDATRTVDAMLELGVGEILFTNAAGGLRAGLNAGSLMSIGHVRCWPYSRWRPPEENMKPDYVVEGTDARGTYCWVHGPTYETRAEIRALQKRGADAVGMSTAPELARCRELGICAGGIACITNDCLSPHSLNHDAVVRVASAASLRLVACIRAWLPSR